jgi:hypothetical protein
LAFLLSTIGTVVAPTPATLVLMLRSGSITIRIFWSSATVALTLRVMPASLNPVEAIA